MDNVRLVLEFCASGTAFICFFWVGSEIFGFHCLQALGFQLCAVSDSLATHSSLNPITLLPHNLGVLLVGSLDFNFLGFYMNYSKEAKSLTFRRGSEVGPVTLQPNNPITL